LFFIKKIVLRVNVNASYDVLKTFANVHLWTIGLYLVCCNECDRCKRSWL